MSWYGTHPRVSKAAVIAVFPAGACKRCVYLGRVAVSTFGDWNLPERCPRCGIDQRRALYHLRGWSNRGSQSQ